MTDTARDACSDRWHEGGFAARYIVEETQGPGWIGGQGYRCRTCGMRTMAITDDVTGEDVTDRFVVSTWEPSLWTRALESVKQTIDQRKYRRMKKRPCSQCGVVKPPAAWGGRPGYLCSDCFALVIPIEPR